VAELGSQADGMGRGQVKHPVKHPAQLTQRGGRRGAGSAGVDEQRGEAPSPPGTERDERPATRHTGAATGRAARLRRAAAVALRWPVRRALPPLVRVGPALAVLVVATFLRFWQLTSVGFNSDEAVYAGTAGSIAGDQSLRSMFPVFRAHPLLFQTILSATGTGRPSDFAARAVPAAIGVGTVLMTYLIGRRLYGRSAGTLAALLLAVMPYHILVSRQVLLDGLMTFCATVVLYCVVRYAGSGRPHWLLAAGAMMGLTVLSKETSVVLLGGLYAFFALTPRIRIRGGHLLGALVVMALTIAPFPLVLSLSGRAGTGPTYLLWQMFRRANHEALFYFRVVPNAVGVAVLAAALLGVVWLRGQRSWREGLLLCWLVVPVAFFSLWPVKGYQYLLPIAPPLAVLAGRTLSRLPAIALLQRRRWLPRAVLVAASLATAASLLLPAWAQINPAPTGTFLAGTGGLPGGREAGQWVRLNVPANAQLLAIGPSVANVLEFYGGRRILALSVSPVARDRNPSYVPVTNPDRALHEGEFQYIVWDSYTADRAGFFANQARRLIDKYHGVAVYTSAITARAKSGAPVTQPVIVIYEVRAA
jgi:4-amino-4-deoxy-L-arabinose transferase-like glycosyltransferase